MEQTWPYIIGLAQLIGIVLLYFHQRSIIKTQKAAIESQKVAIEGMQSFNQIFDVDKVKGYVDIINNKNQLELQMLKQELEAKHGDVESESAFWLEQWKHQTARIKELASILVIAIYYYEPKRAENLIKNRMPLNGEVMTLMLDELKKKYPGGMKKNKRGRGNNSPNDNTSNNPINDNGNEG